MEKSIEELELELESERIAEKELNVHLSSISIKDIMERIESERLSFKYEYSQKQLAESAGMSLSTYKNYLTDVTDSIPLLKFHMLIEILEMDLIYALYG